MIGTECECFIDKPLPETMTDDELYDYFLKNIYFAHLKIMGYDVEMLEQPFQDNRMQGYFHITSRKRKDLGGIRMKEKRAYYINYIAPIINNCLKCKDCSNEDCGKIKYWIAPYNGTKRLKLLYTNKDINYIVILEQHKKKMLLITAYLVDEPKYLDNLLDEYNRYKK